MLPHPTKSRAGLAPGMLTALGCRYKHAREDILSRGHIDTCSNESPRNGVISNAAERGREPQGEGETGWCQALQSRRLPQPVRHREPLFLGSEPWGPGRTHSQSRTWPSSCAVPEASTRSAEDCAGTVQPLAGKTGGKKSWHMAPASPSLPAV